MSGRIIEKKERKSADECCSIVTCCSSRRSFCEDAKKSTGTTSNKRPRLVSFANAESLTKKPRLASFAEAKVVFRRIQIELKEESTLEGKNEKNHDPSLSSVYACQRRMEPKIFRLFKLEAEIKELQQTTHGVWNHRIMEGHRKDRVSELQQAGKDSGEDFDVTFKRETNQFEWE
jgi:hypothetical protein